MTSSSAARAFFDELVDFAASAPGVLGLALTGSRSTGFHRPDSDYDCALVFAGDRVTMPDHLRDPPDGFDLQVFTEGSFANHAAWGSETAWDGYAWWVADFLVDRSNGALPAAAREKGRVPAEEVEPHIDASLDWYLNQVARSRSCWKREDAGAARLEAAESVRPFLQAAFALQDRRRVPYYKYLRWEMERRPLTKLDVGPETLAKLVTALVTDGSPEAQRRVLDLGEAVFRQEGFGLRYDQWETDEWRASGFGAGGHGEVAAAGHGRLGAAGDSDWGPARDGGSRTLGDGAPGAAGHMDDGDAGHTDHGDVGHTDHGDVGHTDHGHVGHTDHGDVGHTDHGDAGHMDHGDAGHTDHGDAGHTNEGAAGDGGLGAGDGDDRAAGDDGLGAADGDDRAAGDGSEDRDP